MLKKIICSAALFVALVLGACSSEKDYLITIHTPYGEMHAVLYDVTSEHKENFIELAEKGMYDSTIFHRVIKDFMVQGGDVNAKPSVGEKDKIDYTVPAEFVDTLFHKKGAIAAARQGDQVNPERASSGSQFYIVQGAVFSEEQLTTDMNKLGKGIQTLIKNNYDYASLEQELMELYNTGDFDAYTQRIMELKPIVEEELNIDVDRKYPAERLQAYTTIGGAPHLDDTYTVFGQVIDGLAVIDSIAAQPTGADDKPLEDIHMTVEVERMPKKKIIKQYDFQY